MRSLLLILAAFFSTFTHAGVVTYSIALRINSVDQINCSPERPTYQFFGCPGVGDTFAGAISFDSDVLQSDGEKTVKPIRFLQIFGDWQFSTSDGFRDQKNFAVGPTLVIENGELLALVGGVFGYGDFSWIDWTRNNTFKAHDYLSNSYYGTVAISQIPEPASLFLVGSALVLMVATRRKGSVRNGESVVDM